MTNAAAKQSDAGARTSVYRRAFGFTRIPFAVRRKLIAGVAAAVAITAAIILAPLGESLVEDAVESMLKSHPQWRGKFVMVQAAAPTRTRLATYKTVQDEAVQLAQEINARFADCAIPPIKLVIRHHDPDEVFELFRACDVCIVSSLHDGMNLVAKEFVAARNDEAGVLLLSSFAGASRELAEALIINPYDGFSTGEALHQALIMPLEEQRARMRLMRSQVSQKNVYRWAGQMLLDAAALQKRKRLLEVSGETHSQT